MNLAIALTIELIVHWTSLLWLLLAAVWLGAAPFVKKPLYRQSGWSRVEQVALSGLGLYLIFGSPMIPAWANAALYRVTVPIGLGGLGLVMVGLGFSIWARLALGENWSDVAMLRQDHTLVRRGPYRVVRHPIYTGLLVALLGTALEHGLMRSFLGVGVCGVGLWLKLVLEERIMIQRFGEEYLRYRRAVDALVPFLF